MLILFFLLAVSTTAQVQLLPDSSYVQDGALVLRFKLTNATDHTVSLTIDKRRSLRQLNAPHTADDLLSSIPLNFVSFYHKDVFMDEEPAGCDNQLPQSETIQLQQGQVYPLLFQTHCLSETVLTQLNKGNTLQYKMYIHYEESGMMQTVKTERVKLKVKKPKF
ncbi:MAG: hypothetical protein V4651_03505 [Bacteroidota bacterium]